VEPRTIISRFRLQAARQLSSAVVAPTVTTPTATLIGSTTATLGANVTSNGGATITAHGTVWGTSPTPTGNAVAEGGTTTATTTTAAGRLPYHTTRAT
jgi:hypothetical protein